MTMWGRLIALFRGAGGQSCAPVVGTSAVRVGGNACRVAAPGIQTAPPPASLASAATLRQFLRRDCMSVALLGTTKAAVIDELIALLADRQVITDIPRVRDAILAREALMSTAMEAGLAIPHARTAAVPKLVCSVGVHPSGIDFGAMDEAPSRIFVLTLSPKDAPAPHVQFMATLSRVLDEAGRARVLAAGNVDELWAALCGE